MDNLITRVDLDQISRNPVARWIVFLVALGVLAAIDINAELVMLDRSSIYPFLVLAVVPASLSLKIGWRAIQIFRRCCIVIGVSVCGLNVLSIVSNMNEVSQFLSAQRLVYAPLALGLILSFLIKIIEPKKIEKYRTGILEVFLVALFIPLVTAASIHFVAEGLPLTNFISPSALGVCVLISIVCLVHPDFSELRIVERAFNASLAMVVVFVVIGVSTWTFGISSGDIASLGEIIAFATIGILYGSLFALFTICLGGQVDQTNKIVKFFDWHMIEAYAFYALIIMPPLSMLELFNAL